MILFCSPFPFSPVTLCNEAIAHGTETEINIEWKVNTDERLNYLIEDGYRLGVLNNMNMQLDKIKKKLTDHLKNSHTTRTIYLQA